MQIVAITLCRNAGFDLIPFSWVPVPTEPRSPMMRNIAKKIKTRKIGMMCKSVTIVAISPNIASGGMQLNSNDVSVPKEKLLTAIIHARSCAKAMERSPWNEKEDIIEGSAADETASRLNTVRIIIPGASSEVKDHLLMRHK